MGNEESNQQKCSDRVKHRNGLKSADVQAQHFVTLRIAVEHINEAGKNHNGNDKHLQSGINEFLKRIQFAQDSLLRRMRGISEDSEDIVFSLGAQVLPCRQILFPFAGREMPKNRKGNQDEETSMLRYHGT